MIDARHVAPGRRHPRAAAAIAGLIAALWGTGAAAAGCATVKACYAAAIADQVEYIAPIGPQPGASCSNGCLRVNTPLNSFTLPYTQGISSQLASSSYQISVSQTGPVEAMQVSLAPVSPADGLTLELDFPGYTYPPGPVHGLVAITDAEGVPLVALGVQDGGLLYGRRGLNGAEGWVPVWNPDKLQVRAASKIYLRFEPSGKVRIDVLQGNNLPDVVWSSNLMDVGWPIARYPTGYDPKTFLQPLGLQIGQIEWAHIGPNRMISGVRQIMVYRRALSDAEIVALFAANAPDSTLALSSCSTGVYLSDKLTTATKTFCGERLSTLAPINLPAAFNVRDADGYAWAMPNPPRPMFTSTDAESLFVATPVGANNFIIRNNTGLLPQQSGTEVLSSTAQTEPAASQYWHLFTPTGDLFSGQVYMRSLGNGDLIGVGTLDHLNLSQSGLPWTIEPVQGAKTPRLPPISAVAADPEDRHPDR